MSQFQSKTNSFHFEGKISFNFEGEISFNFEGEISFDNDASSFSGEVSFHITTIGSNYFFQPSPKFACHFSNIILWKCYPKLLWDSPLQLCQGCKLHSLHDKGLQLMEPRIVQWYAVWGVWGPLIVSYQPTPWLQGCHCCTNVSHAHM